MFIATSAWLTILVLCALSARFFYLTQRLDRIIDGRELVPDEAQDPWARDRIGIQVEQAKKKSEGLWTLFLVFSLVLGTIAKLTNGTWLPLAATGVVFGVVVAVGSVLTWLDHRKLLQRMRQQ